MNKVKEILKSIKNIFLDVDGTLFSSEEILEEVYYNAILNYLKSSNVSTKIPGREEIMKYIGLPVKEIFSNLLPELSEEDRKLISDNVLKELVLRIERGEGKHYEGVRETVKYLFHKGYKLITASNGRKPYVDIILKVNQIYKYFFSYEYIDNIQIHNKIQLVKNAMLKHNLQAKETVIIGDRNSDREAALENKIYFIAADYGHGTLDERDGALIRLQSFSEIKNYL